jgi:hypothetical protein
VRQDEQGCEFSRTSSRTGISEDIELVSIEVWSEKKAGTMSDIGMGTDLNCVVGPSAKRRAEFQPHPAPIVTLNTPGAVKDTTTATDAPFVKPRRKQQRKSKQ